VAKYFCVDRVPKFKLYTANPAWTYSSPEELNGASYMGKVRLIEMVPWHSLYKHSLYVTKFIRTFFIRDRVYTGQSLYRTKFIQGQSLYEDKVYTGTKFIRDKVHTVTKFIRGQSLYNFFHTVPGTRIKRLMIKC
jgi:hypothetical protein